MRNRKNNKHRKNKHQSRVCMPCTGTCSICLDVVNNNSCELDCGHIYHTKCINTWFNQQWSDSQKQLESELTLFLLNNVNGLEAPFCAAINGTIACYLGESAIFSCPMCKLQFTTKENIDSKNPVFKASDMAPILCKIDMGNLYGLKCTCYITNLDTLYYFMPKHALSFYDSPDEYDARYMAHDEPLSVHGKHLLVCKGKLNFFKQIMADIINGNITNLKMYTTLLEEIILLPDSMFNENSKYIEKQLFINDIGNHIHPEWF